MKLKKNHRQERSVQWQLQSVNFFGAKYGSQADGVFCKTWHANVRACPLVQMVTQHARCNGGGPIKAQPRTPHNLVIPVNPDS